MKKVIICSPVHDVLVKGLIEQGYVVQYKPAITYDELKNEITDAFGLVITTRIRVDKNLLDTAGKLKWIGRLGSGMELVDEAYATSKGIKCISTPEGNRNAVAEHTLGLLLNLLNNISKSNNEVKQLEWLRTENTGSELSGKEVGIIGFGNTGSSFARLLEPFNVNVLAYDKYKSGFSDRYISEVQLNDLFDNADIVSMHLPLTAETRYLANEVFFNSFRKPIYYISTCRGAVTKTQALIEALENRVVSGAALDVLENENPSTYKQVESEQLQSLLNHPKVIITPHIAGYSNEAFIKMPYVLLEKLNHLGY